MVLACLSAALLLGGGSAGAAAETEDVIVLGAAVSLTGKYAQNGANTKNGYDLAVAKIEVKGTKRATEESILRLAQVNDGDNMLGIDTDEVARTVKARTSSSKPRARPVRSKRDWSWCATADAM